MPGSTRSVSADVNLLENKCSMSEVCPLRANNSLESEVSLIRARARCARIATKIKTDTAAARATNRTGEVEGKDQKGSILWYNFEGAIIISCGKENRTLPFVGSVGSCHSHLGRTGVCAALNVSLLFSTSLARSFKALIQSICLVQDRSNIVLAFKKPGGCTLM